MGEQIPCPLMGHMLGSSTLHLSAALCPLKTGKKSILLKALLSKIDTIE